MIHFRWENSKDPSAFGRQLRKPPGDTAEASWLHSHSTEASYHPIARAARRPSPWQTTMQPGCFCVCPTVTELSTECRWSCCFLPQRKWIHLFALARILFPSHSHRCIRFGFSFVISPRSPVGVRSSIASFMPRFYAFLACTMINALGECTVAPVTVCIRSLVGRRAMSLSR